MTGDGRRPRRAAEAIRAYLAQALQRELADPRLASVVLTEVSLTDDLSLVRVSVRLLVGDDDPRARRVVVESLSHASGRLRHRLGVELGWRRAPELRFTYDDGHDAVRRVEEILSEISDEPAGSSESD